MNKIKKKLSAQQVTDQLNKYHTTGGRLGGALQLQSELATATAADVEVGMLHTQKLKILHQF